MEINPLTMYFLSFLLICQWSYQYFETALSKAFILFLLFIVFNFFMYFKYHHWKSHSNQLVPHAALPPGPRPWPLVGCLPSMWRNMPTHRWVHSIMKQFNTEIACIRLGNIHVIPVSSPELAMEFLKTHDSVFSSLPITISSKMVADGFLGTVLSPMGDQWKKMRRILASQILHPSRLSWMLDKRTEESDSLVSYIFNKSRNGEMINVRSIAQHYCGNIIRRMMFNRRYFNRGAEDGGPSFEEEEHNQALFAVLLNTFSFSVADYMPCLKPFDLDGHEKKVKNALKIISKYNDPIINERVQQWENGIRKEVEDILDIFITLKDENGKSILSVKEIKAQITELQTATIDNPSNAVEWAMAELLNHPKILQKAVQELDQVIGRERLVQESDIPKLKYLTACVRESFRLHPFAPFNVPHVSTSDVVVSGYFIPKGSEVLLSRSGLGRNPRIWEDPMRFDPERHLKDEMIELGLSEPNLRFISFTRGRRGCIGSSLGTNITMMLFARILQGFSWSLPSGMTKIDFSESDEIFLPNTLHLYAKPRLPHFMYPTF